MKKTNLVLAFAMALTILSCKKTNMCSHAAKPQPQTAATASATNTFSRLTDSYGTYAAFGERTTDKATPCRHRPNSVCGFSIAAMPTSNTDVYTLIKLSGALAQLSFDAAILKSADGAGMFDGAGTFTLPADAELKDTDGTHFKAGQVVLLKAGAYSYTQDKTSGALMVANVAVSVN